MSSETITKEGIEESNLYLQKCEAELKDKYDYTLLSKIAKLGDKKFVYEYLKANIDKIIKNLGKKTLMDNIKNMGFEENQKKELFKIMLNKFKFEFFIMEDLLTIGCDEYVYENIDMIISTYSEKLSAATFSQSIYELSLDKQYKISLLKSMLEKNIYEFSILENLINMGEVDYAHVHVQKIIEKYIHNMEISMITSMVQGLSLPSKNKESLFLYMLNSEAYDVYILDALIKLEDNKAYTYVETYIGERIEHFVENKGVDTFIEDIKILNLSDKVKIEYLESILRIKPDDVNVLKALLNYFDDEKKKINKINELIETTYKNCENMLQVYLIKAALLSDLSKYKQEIPLLKKCLKLDKKFANRKEIGDILYKISSAYSSLGEINSSKSSYKYSFKYYNKSKKYKNEKELPYSSARDESWKNISKWQLINKVGIVIVGCILVYISFIKI